jgi:carboxyl-terminal processing protease
MLKMGKWTRYWTAALLLAFILVSVLAIHGDPAAVYAQEEEQETEKSPEEIAREKKIQLIIKVLEYIEQNYVKEVTLDDLVRGAVKGMIESLGDPYSNYFDQQEYSEFQVETTGTFGGIGIIITMKNNYVTVMTTLENSPALKAGLKAGDRIIQVDGKDVSGYSLSEAASMIRGPEGTQVSLGVLREGERGTLNFVITRDVIHINPIEADIIEEGIGYIKITKFNENTADNLNKTLEGFAEKGVKGIILDLRNNPGGLLDQAIKVAEKFVPEGPIVKVVNREGEITTLSSTSNPTPYPLVVLVNEGSASASEIVAGAIQDRGMGVLVGTRTFGKATVQTTANLGSLGGFKMTTATYVTPNGRDINREGITPDVVVELPDPGQHRQEFAPLGEKRHLYKGVIGLDVYGIQQRLRYLGFDPGEPDGIYGQQTARAVANFQQYAGLAIKGTVDNATYEAIEKFVEEKINGEILKDTQLEKALEILKGKLN